MNEYKGREFKGLMAGASYKKWAVLLGFTVDFYRKGIGMIPVKNNIKVLDIGCGPGSFTYALAEKLPDNCDITGIDISEEQLTFAEKHKDSYPCTVNFNKCSMDELNFPDSYFDHVITSMAMHETPPNVRRKALKEISRVLKQGAYFLLVDWCKPKLGLYGAIWSPILFFINKEYKDDNWNNKYRQLCEDEGFILKEDFYINSIARRQLFLKQ